MILETKFDQRPWGYFHQFCENEAVTVKIITVNPGQQLSVQKHKHRDELWIPLDSGLVAIVGGKELEMLVDNGKAFGQVYIPRKTIHSVRNDGKTKARFLEVAFGIFDEDDIERLEDKYGRTS